MRCSRRAAIAATAAAGVLGAATGLGGVAWYVSSLPATNPPGPSLPIPVDLSRAKVIYGGDQDSVPQFENNQYTISAKKPTLVALGSTQAGEQQTIKVNVHFEPLTNSPPISYVGVFFGYRNSDAGPVFQLVNIELREGREPKLERSMIQIDSPGYSDFRRVELPKRSAHSLEWNIGDSGLESLAWDDMDVPTLCRPEFNEQTKPADYVGEWGVYLKNSVVTIHSATVSLSGP